MRVICLETSGTTYTSNAYLVLGDWNRLKDVNTLVDTGRDPAVLDAITEARRGVGQRPVAQVVLTHCHYDRVGVVPQIRERFQPVVAAASRHFSGVDRVLTDGDIVRAGDRDLEVIATPGHSSDSICLYGTEERALFSGDTPLFLHSRAETYETSFVEALERISKLDVRVVYPGHGAPVTTECNERIAASWRKVSKEIHR